MTFVETREALHEPAGDLSRRRKRATGSEDDFTLAVLERGWGTPPRPTRRLRRPRGHVRRLLWDAGA
jgi:hypothetical protein